MARLERKPAENVAVTGLIVQTIGMGLAFAFSRISGAATAWVLTWQIAVGIGVWLLCLMHLRASRLAEEETEDWERMQAERAAGGAKGKLFEEDELQAFAARNRLRFMEKYLAPTFSVLVALLLILVVVLAIVLKAVTDAKLRLDSSLLIIALMSGMTFLLFLISMYASGMSRQTEWRALRGGASYMMLSTLFSGATVLALALATFHFQMLDKILAFFMLGLMALVAFEVLANFVLDFYRPRVEGVEARPAYDSRLLGLLAQPGGILKTVAATLDYQFGFRVSQTWFYKFIGEAIAPLLLFLLITFYLLTCLVIIGPEQNGILERLGKYERTLPPGLCVKFPWPIDRVQRIPVNEVKMVILGHSHGEEHDAGEHHNEHESEETPILWTVVHDSAEKVIMVGSDAAPVLNVPPVNFLCSQCSVRYRIANVQKWYYSASAPDEVFEALCENEQIKYFGGKDLFALLVSAKNKAGADMQAAIQAAADELDLGVEVLGVGMEGIHPPVATNLTGDSDVGLPESFHLKVDALQLKEVSILAARTEAEKTVIVATGDAEVNKIEAQSFYASRTKAAEAQAKRFDRQVAYCENPDMERVYKARVLMSALEEGLKNVRKYVVAVPSLSQGHYRLDLGEAGRPVLGEIGKFASPEMPEDTKKK